MESGRQRVWWDEHQGQGFRLETGEGKTWLGSVTSIWLQWRWSFLLGSGRPITDGFVCLCVYVCTPGMKPAVTWTRDSPYVVFSLQRQLADNSHFSPPQRWYQSSFNMIWPMLTEKLPDIQSQSTRRWGQPIIYSCSLCSESIRMSQSVSVLVRHVSPNKKILFSQETITEKPFKSESKQYK